MRLDTLFVKGGYHGDRQRTADGIGSIVPALANHARTGHPHSIWLQPTPKGWATRRSIVEDEWGKFNPDRRFSLNSLPNAYTYVGDEITDAADCDKAQEAQFKLSGSAERFEVPPKSVLLVLIGLLGGFVGFTALFACLFLGGNWREVSGSIAVIVSSVVVFHFGLCCLLR
jgi:hypothetical protein